ncbi:MAG: alpha/beta hydrolase, partial [bacterium]|nr:alpha/beta hydrolase [bacterium]
IELAGRVPVAGLIVESSFTSAAEVGQAMFPFIPVKLLTRYSFDNAAKIGGLTCPILITHSPEDDLIPYAMGVRLYELAGETKEFIELSGAHNERLYYESDLYINGLRRFLGLDKNAPVQDHMNGQ